MEENNLFLVFAFTSDDRQQFVPAIEHIFFYASTASVTIIIYFNEVLSMCMIYFIILTVMRIAPLVDHLIQKPRRSIELGLSPWCSKGLFSQSHLSVQTPLQCMYSPHMQSHALRSVHALNPPNTGSHTIVWTHESTAHTDTVPMSEAGLWYEYSPLPTGKSGCRSTAVSAQSFHSVNINF